MIQRIELMYVENIPKELKSNILYVSLEFKVASHLCPCGCRNKIVTPLNDIEWKFTEKNSKATLYPSIGNWQLPCKSHYWIKNGKILWSYTWSEERIEKGRELEAKRVREYYNNRKNNQ